MLSVNPFCGIDDCCGVLDFQERLAAQDKTLAFTPGASVAEPPFCNQRVRRGRIEGPLANWPWEILHQRIGVGGLLVRRGHQTRYRRGGEHCTISWSRLSFVLRGFFGRFEKPFPVHANIILLRRSRCAPAFADKFFHQCRHRFHNVRVIGIEVCCFAQVRGEIIKLGGMTIRFGRRLIAPGPTTTRAKQQFPSTHP